jgi:hypothetical protein
LLLDDYYRQRRALYPSHLLGVQAEDMLPFLSVSKYVKTNNRRSNRPKKGKSRLSRVSILLSSSENALSNPPRQVNYLVFQSVDADDCPQFVEAKPTFTFSKPLPIQISIEILANPSISHPPVSAPHARGRYLGRQPTLAQHIVQGTVRLCDVIGMCKGDICWR